METYTYMYSDPEAFGTEPAPQFRWKRGSRYVELGIEAGPEAKIELLQNLPDAGFESREAFETWCREALEELGPQEAHRLAWGQRAAFMRRR